VSWFRCDCEYSCFVKNSASSFRYGFPQNFDGFQRAVRLAPMRMAYAPAHPVGVASARAHPVVGKPARKASRHERAGQAHPVDGKPARKAGRARSGTGEPAGQPPSPPTAGRKRTARPGSTETARPQLRRAPAAAGASADVPLPESAAFLRHASIIPSLRTCVPAYLRICVSAYLLICVSAYLRDRVPA